ncbi:hypothetical protein B0T25DRAFT_537672 [Lasiosphaeria hispida]|uniref:Uncharacterized protein n=1 Tax=Lasiosphaeria hispida TaxID=260671 RepID=A0AAJ0HLE7_9PEZI|nr:hypothetical protein B0T25DRAFT_537672 [Lasiosphaeria hispida]
MASTDQNLGTVHISDVWDRSGFQHTRIQVLPNAGQRPLPAPPSPTLAVPTSKFSRLRPSVRRWEPKCNHTNMTRIYCDLYRCEVCGRSGKFGWLYRCTMDRDPLIMAARDEGHQVAFDGLGVAFSGKMSLGKCGPDVRREKYSFLNEVTSEQLQSYTPAQLAIVLSQRDNVHAAISEERHRSTHPPHYAEAKYPDDRKPWIPDERFECQYKVCQSCHHFGKDKSWLGLDGVVDGHIPPHAATGFSFNPMGCRPISQLDIVKNLGYRPVPVPKGHMSRRLGQQISSSSTSRIIEIIDGHLDAAQMSSSDYSTSSDSTISDLSVEETEEERGNLPRSPRLQLGGDNAADPCRDEDDASPAALIGIPLGEELVVRLPWTSPIPEFEGVLADDEAKLVYMGSSIPAYNGRNPSSLKTNPAIRAQVFSSIPSLDTASKVIGHTPPSHDMALTGVPYQPEEMCNVGLVLPFNGEVFIKASSVPLPNATPEENLFLAFSAESASETDTVPEGQDALGEVTLDDGVALTEEAVESGTVDVVAQLQATI